MPLTTNGNGVVKELGSAEKKRMALFGSSPSKQAKQGDGIYQEILALEEAESEERPADQDDALFSRTCQELREHMKHVLDLKTSQGEAETGDDIRESRIEGSLLFVTLKKLNRLEKLRVKRCRDRTNAAKQNVDKFNLQLQNLLYEVLHLKKEVTKCINYKSADEAIDMIPEQDFYKEAPEETTRPEATKGDLHLQRLARLEWELATRKKLDEECQALDIERSRLSVEIREKEDKLEQLAPQLTSVLEAAKPVQSYLSLPVEDNRDQSELSRLLPDSLYFLYTQANAYSQASDDMLEVSVEGGEEEAMVLREEEQKKCFYPTKTEASASDSDEEMEVDDLKVSSKTVKLLKKHPLHVKIIVKTELGHSLSCRFYFLLVLGIITVETQVDFKDRKKNKSLDSENILANLYEKGDSGEESPNPSNQFQLRAEGLSESFVGYVANTGRPYMWAQRMAGMDFLPVVHQNSDIGEEGVKIVAEHGMEHMQMEDMVKRIRNRILASL